MILIAIYLFFLGITYIAGELSSIWAILLAVVAGVVVIALALFDRAADQDNQGFVQWHHGFEALQDQTQAVLANIESLTVAGGVPWKDLLSNVVLELTYSAQGFSHQAIAKVQMEDTLMARFMKGDKVWVRIDPKDPNKAYVDLERSPVQVSRL